MSHHDVIVVGIGLSGLTAATRLAESGARVLVLAKGIGSTHLSPCTIDVLGYAPERVERPREALARLGEGHPYSLIGADAIAAAIDWFKGQVPGYTGSLEENLLLPTAVGVQRPTAVVPDSMAAGDLRTAGGEVLVVGFRALKDFHAHLLADNLRRGGIEARAVVLDHVPEGRADVNSLGFARAFDDEAFRTAVAEAVPVGNATHAWRGRTCRRVSAGPCSRCRRCRRRSPGSGSSSAFARRFAGCACSSSSTRSSWRASARARA